MPNSVSHPNNAHSLSPQKLVLWKDYIQVLTRVNKQLDTALRTQAGIKLEDYKIMMVLADAPPENIPDRAVRMGEIAQALSSSPSKLTYQVEKLIQQGWVERSDVSHDRRGKAVRITASGLEKHQEASLIREQLLDRFLFSTLSPEEIDAFGSILHKLTQDT